MKMNILRFRFLLVVPVMVALLATSAASSIIRVKWDSPTDGPGNDWDHAYHTITAAHNAAIAGDEIWVAGDEAHPYFERFTLKSGVGHYGGFAGTESVRDERNWVINKTIIDGSGQGDVVTGAGGATLDGFTVRNGGDSPHASILCNSSSPTITNNTILGSYDGVHCESAGSSPLIMNNTISQNQCAGVTCDYKSSPIVTNNLIKGNNDAICIDDASPLAANNVMSGNNLGVYCGTSTSVFVNNTISGSSIGIYCIGAASPSIANNIVAFNVIGVQNVGTGAPMLNNNCIYNPDGTNYSGLSAGAGDIGLDPKFVSATYGRLHIQPDSPCINAGLDGAVQSGWTDMDGQTRIQGAHVDIGADESDTTSWPVSGAVIVRVSPSGVDDAAHDGSSWALAKRTVQAGVDAATSAGGEVWVAAGAYAEHVFLAPYAYMYGGFAGVESARDERDWVANKSILDGSGSGNVVRPYGCRVGVIDGFAIRNGYSGIFQADLPITNNTIYNNTGPSVYLWAYASVTNNTVCGGISGVSCMGGPSTLMNNRIMGAVPKVSTAAAQLR